MYQFNYVQFRLWSGKITSSSINTQLVWHHQFSAPKMISWMPKPPAKWRFQPSILQCFAPVPAKVWRCAARTLGPTGAPCRSRKFGRQSCSQSFDDLTARMAHGKNGEIPWNTLARNTSCRIHFSSILHEKLGPTDTTETLLMISQHHKLEKQQQRRIPVFLSKRGGE